VLAGWPGVLLVLLVLLASEVESKSMPFLWP
jgi:hypothetical protein